MNLHDIKRIHILGVGGTLMGNFAIMMKNRGIEVSGSDGKIYPPMSDRLREENVKVFEGYSEENLKHLDAKSDLIVIGNVIQRVNPEAKAAESSGVTFTSLPEFMSKYFLEETTNVVVCGTHGKTTTTSVLSYMLEKVNKSPSYFIGGVVPELKESFHLSDFPPSGFFVLEGDEYDTAYWDKVPKFNHYKPNQIILTSIEFDHADIYQDISAIRKAFDGLAPRLRENGLLIYRGDDPEIKGFIDRNEKTFSDRSIRLFSFGKERRCDYQYRNYHTDGLAKFEVYFRSEKILDASSHLVGDHNVHNILSTIAIAHQNNLDLNAISKALSEFKGVRRRQELRGEVFGVKIIDDFAHHPTAVKETIKALKSKFPQKRLLVAFEPRSATSRRKVFQEQYAQSFDGVDQVWISEPYNQSNIDPKDCFSTDDLVSDLKSRGLKAEVLQSGDARIQQINLSAQENAVLAVLSNGSFEGLIPALLKMNGS